MNQNSWLVCFLVASFTPALVLGDWDQTVPQDEISTEDPDLPSKQVPANGLGQRVFLWLLSMAVIYGVVHLLEDFSPETSLPVEQQEGEVRGQTLWTLLRMASFLALLLGLFWPAECWSYEPAAATGCHLHPVNVTVMRDRRGICHSTHSVQACVGYCESSAFPSKHAVLVASGFKHNITSVSQCCTMSKTQKVKVRLRCGKAWRETIELFTAKACQCDVCRLSRY